MASYQIKKRYYLRYKIPAWMMIIGSCVFGFMSAFSYFVGLSLVRFGEVLVLICVSIGAVGLICALNIMPLYSPVLPTYWHPIKHANRVNILPRSQSSTNRIREYYWRNKVNQYSLIEDYDRHSVKKICVVWFKENMLSQVSPIAPFIKKHPVEDEDVSVPDSVRKSVAIALQDINGRPTNGTRSLQRNRDWILDDLTWTCTPSVASHAHTILIWHIATSYCDMLPGKNELLATNTSYNVAKLVSRYCAYLVAFLPELLPEPSFKTTITFQKVLQEAQDGLGQRRMSMEEKRKKILELHVPETAEGQTTFEKGIRLGQQLSTLNNDNDLRGWKIMEEFWSETILYVAPSDNATAHIDQLANGGEFVTHLWAMLSNAGILKRATDDEWSPPRPQPAVPSFVTTQIPTE